MAKWILKTSKWIVISGSESGFLWSTSVFSKLNLICVSEERWRKSEIAFEKVRKTLRTKCWIMQQYYRQIIIRSPTFSVNWVNSSCVAGVMRPQLPSGSFVFVFASVDESSTCRWSGRSMRLWCALHRLSLDGSACLRSGDSFLSLVKEAVSQIMLASSEPASFVKYNVGNMIRTMLTHRSKDLQAIALRTY